MSQHTKRALADQLERYACWCDDAPDLAAAAAYLAVHLLASMDLAPKARAARWAARRLRRLPIPPPSRR